MSTANITIAGQPVYSAVLHHPAEGVWFADITTTDDAKPIAAGPATLIIGKSSLVGTIQDFGSNSFQSTRSLRLVGGAGGWAKQVSVKPAYHNDAGVSGRIVADDTAREVGERIVEWPSDAAALGPDYVRDSGTAAKILTDVARGVPWWVALDGTTHVAKRPSGTVNKKAYVLQNYEPVSQRATIQLDDPAAVLPGMSLDVLVSTPITIRELVITITPEKITADVWCGTAAGSELESAMRGIVAALTPQLYGHYRYRVVRHDNDRVNLQPVRQTLGLPDLKAISLWVGVSGATMKLTPGCEVLVVFEGGDRSYPMAVAYAPKGGNGFAPVHVDLGGEAGAPAARSGDSVEVLLPPAIFSGTIAGSPASGVLTFPMNKALGTITAGSSKVGIAT
jgi:hypothetical protein